MFYEEIFISAYSGFTDTQCLAATITNYKKCSGLKQHKFIILEFCRAEVIHLGTSLWSSG